MCMRAGIYIDINIKNGWRQKCMETCLLDDQENNLIIANVNIPR